MSILPLKNTVLFPGVVIPITVGRDKSIKLVKDCYKGKKIIGTIAQKKTEIDEEETFLRQNFSESDNRNYRDGDIESTRLFGQSQDEDIAENKRPETTNMYDAPTHPKVSVNDDGQIVRTKDKSGSRTSLITDEVRVYKGGSWKDRAYWLDPAQRRYLPQYIATDHIGFRGAMSRLGSKSKSRKTARHKRKS